VSSKEKKSELVSVESGGELVPVKLPDVLDASSEMLDELTKALGVPRDVLAENDQIEHAWDQLPRHLKQIPPKLRDKRIAKACVAIACGLFDAAISYFWNAAIAELRNKVRRFGLAIIPQILDDKTFDEGSLLDLKDAELLDLCLKLNLISDDDFFFLDQCRATRNSFSSAHPSDGEVDDDELLTFVGRCRKHALSSTHNPKGVDTKAFLSALKTARFKKLQLDEWRGRIDATFDAQRELIFPMLHGIFCDPTSGEEARVNALAICDIFADDFTPMTRSILVDRHQEYRAKGDEERYKASTKFFEELNLLSLLGDAELHSLITTASQKLLSVHNAWDNFHNEPPFAERLEKITNGVRVPASAQPQFVEAVVTCGIGNQYGVSNAAIGDYRRMIESFSPAEIKLMLDLPTNSMIVASRLKSAPSCEKRYRQLVALLDETSVPTSAKSVYKKWLPK
jgi:hypothetical protein